MKPTKIHSYFFFALTALFFVACKPSTSSKLQKKSEKNSEKEKDKKYERIYYKENENRIKDIIKSNTYKIKDNKIQNNNQSQIENKNKSTNI